MNCNDKETKLELEIKMRFLPSVEMTAVCHCERNAMKRGNLFFRLLRRSSSQ